MEKIFISKLDEKSPDFSSALTRNLSDSAPNGLTRKDFIAKKISLRVEDLFD